MFRIAVLTVFAFSTALAFGAAPVRAQSDMTAQEIAEAFKKQKTRGLVIVPTGQPAVSGEATSVTPAATEPSYSAVEKSDQVNIQISFDFDSAALREDQKPKLATLCEVMKAVDVEQFQIIGHTDSSGGAAYNQRLSLLRAQEVKRHLVSACGIGADRLDAIGMGEKAPFDTADPRADVNRRVEFQALG
ncbi:MAG: OmpA family protein [Pseudodonghicola sp.]|nr:OmpA family protein [Pseudodonghicola sp.]